MSWMGDETFEGHTTGKEDQVSLIISDERRKLRQKHEDEIAALVFLIQKADETLIELSWRLHKETQLRDLTQSQRRADVVERYKQEIVAFSTHRHHASEILNRFKSYRGGK